MPDGFSLEFDIKFRTEEHNFGYIFRIIGNDNVSFDLISNHKGNDKVLSFVEGNKVSLPFKNINEADDKKWNKVVFKLDLKLQEITIFFNENIELKTPCLSKDLSNFRFQFGVCNHEKFMSHDVPPISIKDIRLLDNQKKLIACWPLEKHHIDEVYDSVSNLVAIAYNPVWEIDKHTRWIQEKHFETSLYTQVAFNANIVYFANNDYLSTYDLAENRMDTIRPVSGYPFHVSSNQLIYNPYTDQLISYDLEYIRASIYDFKNNTWSGNEPTLRTPYTHHNSFISPVDSCVYVFGGYGDYLYKSDLIKLDFNGHTQKAVLDDKSITPRYLSAIGFKNPETLLLLGGYGNESGKQELGPHNYYDLYEINLKNFHVKKLWKLDQPNEHYLFSNAMVVDTLQNRIYTLIFPNDRNNSHILLKSFNLENGSNEILGDTIPYTFEDINSFCSLVLDTNNNKLYAVTIYNNQVKSDIFVYSLLYPPLSNKEIIQKAPQSQLITNVLPWLIIIVFVCGSCWGIFIYAKKYKQNKTSNPVVFDEIENDDPIFEYPVKKSSILFLNGFQVWDKSGNDITREFTPTLKYLLILMVLYTHKNEKGVSNTTLRETLWNDKPEDNAQNNRRVYIQKLKKLLSKLDGVEVINTNTYWTLKCQEPCFSDYFKVLQLINELKNQEKIELDKLKELLYLLSYGTPLPYLHQQWADPFISDYSLKVQDLLWSLVQHISVINDPKLQISIAETIFLFDSTSEEALSLKCSMLCKMGKIRLAKIAYDSFSAEYERTIGIPFSKNFDFIIKYTQGT